MDDQHFQTRTHCRICGDQTTAAWNNYTALEPVAYLGETPLADRFLDAANDPEESFPLGVAFCPRCSLLQLTCDVDDDILFGADYAFFTGASPSSIQYFADYAKDTLTRFPDLAHRLTVEIASNDGTLLKHFADAGCPVVGVEPAEPPAQAALAAGIPTSVAPFTAENAKTIRDRHGAAGLVLANNVVAHVRDPRDLFAGVRHLLADDGVFVFEVQYLPHLLFPTAFDHIYHEHRSFFSLTPLMHLADLTDFTIFDVQEADTQGGSLRVFACKRGSRGAQPAVAALLASEEQLELVSHERPGSVHTSVPAGFRSFRTHIRYTVSRLQELLARLKSEGKTIYGYGASAKGNTLLNVAGIGADILDCIVDTTPYKIGKFSPGMHIPVVAPGERPEPDYYLLLVWNYLPGVLAREEAFRAGGGHFILPIPTPLIV
jgi:SAM-dependent methyltransferase